MSDELLIPEADIAMAARKIVQAGRKTKRRNTGPTLTLGTIKAVHDYDGNMVADVTVRGADLLGLDMTVDCVNAQPGDRCVIQEQAHHAMVTGILAKPGAWVPVTRMVWWKCPYSDDSLVFVRCGNIVTVNGFMKFTSARQCNHQQVNEKVDVGWRPISGASGIISFTGNANPTLSVSDAGVCTLLGELGNTWCAASGAWVTSDPMP